jgi:Na+/H+-dicarboxylate symporter
MSPVFFNLTALAAAAVFVVLLAGIWNMGRQGEAANLSQKLMRWRVGLQFVALILAMIFLLLVRGTE